jgi:hypothetical protein
MAAMFAAGVLAGWAVLAGVFLGLRPRPHR